jgi:hypothetical protein
MKVSASIYSSTNKPLVEVIRDLDVCVVALYACPQPQASEEIHLT